MERLLNSDTAKTWEAGDAIVVKRIETSNSKLRAYLHALKLTFSRILEGEAGHLATTVVID